VVALSNAWQKGAQQWTPAQRAAFHDDPGNLLAVDGPLNVAKGDGDAATWLPPNRASRCAFVARQVAVKHQYQLWVTPAEREAIERVLRRCPDEPIPTSLAAATGQPAPPSDAPPTSDDNASPSGSDQVCDPAYPTVCIPPVQVAGRRLSCADIDHRNFEVLAPDPHRLDGDKDGLGCESTR
jgi:hypothetical protein